MSLDREYAVVSNGGDAWEVDHRYGVPHLYDYFVPSSFAAEVAWAVGAQGPATVVSTGCTSGLDSVGHAVELIREGSADVMVAGASDAPISPITLACFDAIKATSPRNDDPEHASRPFDRTRNGFVLGEGSAVFVLEELETAHRRGARIYAEISGFSSRCNAYHMTGLRPDGRELAEAIRLALTAAAEALADSEVDLARLPEYAAGVVTASSAGGFEFGQRELQALWSKGSAHVSARPRRGCRRWSRM
jgi:act minimal PKS ketosynthase (KS/KS alpha)